MPTRTTSRYTFAPYTGPKSKHTCPACGKPRCFSRYLDTTTGELLPDEFGKCDHEVKCAYHRHPGTRPAGGGLSYATATERGERATGYVAPARPARLAPPPVLTIPADVYRATLGSYERNHLAQLLQTHFGKGVADKLLQRFHIGTSAHWPGACVFWMLDEQGRVRGGEVVLYDATGHTVKTPHRHTTWAHTALTAAHQKHGQPVPAWLTEYNAHGQKSPCLFGLPQLAAAPAWQPVALVESAKTALLLTPYEPNFLWMATRGLASLTPERLAPLRGRRLTLYPDAGAYARWEQKATELRAHGHRVEVSDALENLATPAEREAGIDWADVLLAEWPGYPPNWDE